MAGRSTMARRTTNCSGQAATCDCNGLAMVDFHRESLLINEEARKTDNAFASVQCGVTGRLGCIDRSQLRYLNPRFFFSHTQQTQMVVDVAWRLFLLKLRICRHTL